VQKLNRRKRAVKESNGLIQKELNRVTKRGEVSEIRRQVGLFARATERTAEQGRSEMLTYGAQIRKSVPPPMVWEQIDKDYLTLHSHEKGSLAHLLLSAHALGFRLFSKAPAAMQFLASKEIEQYERNLRAKIEGQDKIAFPTLTISKIYESVTTSVRGKGDNTDPAPLVTRFHLAFCGTPPKKGEDSLELALITAIAKTLCDKYRLWSELIADPLGASQCIMESLADHGIVYEITPAIKILMDKAEQKGDLKKRTIVFDPKSPQFPIDGSPEFLIIALIAKYAQEARLNGATNIANTVKESITTSNGNGLGWFFGKGIELIVNASTEEIKTYLGIDKNDPSFGQLVELLEGIHAPAIFNKNVLADARYSVQGGIDSTISNHVGRLSSSIQALENREGVSSLLQQFSEALKADASKTLQGLGNLPEVLSKFEGSIEYGVRALRILNGECDGYITESLIQTAIDDYTRTKSTISYLMSCANVLTSAVKRGEAIPVVEIPSQWNDLIALPHFSEYIYSVVEDRRQLIADTSKQIEKFKKVMGGLTTTYELDFNKALENRKNFYLNICKKTKKSALKLPELVGYRDLLSRLTSTIYRGSDQLRKAGVEALWSSGVFESKHDLREHCWQRKHYIHVSPLDTKPKKLIRLKKRKVSIVELCDALLALPDITLSDQLNLELLRASLLLLALPSFLRSESIDSKIVREFGDYRFRTLLDSTQIERSIAISLLVSAYRSAISGKIYRLNKREFVLTRSFRAFTGQKIIYSPKKSSWKVPPQLFEGRYKDILQSELCAWGRDGTLDVTRTTEKIAQNDKADVHMVDALAFLKEMPHRFFIAADIKGWGDTAFGVQINNGKIERSGTMSGLVPIGQSRDNNKIVALLNMVFDGSKISPPIIQFERSYRVDEQKELLECKDKRRVTVQIPANYVSDAAAKKVWEPCHIIGIDPGVYGMGVCLMTLDGIVRDKGFISINSLIGYCKRKDTHRSVATPRQQYRAPFSDHLSRASKAAIGDITHIIDRLIGAFNAIPVFELPGGSKDPSSGIWGTVQSLYCWGDNDSQNNVRKSHWKGATHWDTKFLRRQQEDAKAKPLIAYPGTRVSSYGNSFKCCECGRNAIEDAKSLVSKTKRAEIVDGKLSLPGGVVHLVTPDSKTVVERRKKNKGPIYTQIDNKIFDKLSSTSKSAADLITTIRRSIRRAPTDRYAKQGIDSLYVCPYIDCKNHINADANSAVNVARKFVEQLC
jgi:hypothetical protein